ncbi:beta-N-acetylhexosaminidase [Rivibacter subsaxonicus]|uniref:Beta-N-acetylhexosaminidase n=1 Tax=Rivibacter subsaxonicus TaxID=457575 RepID=A0A4Q7V5S1_9BURK|nr:beta-N-acetylhexosaminidase [Rivibacter subsaxonicus]RZT91901.1 beta-N-acetylhexosaminidase [Rivibacter subsaxonicus]
MNSNTIRPGHLVMVDMDGTSLAAATADFIREHDIRAVCLFRKNLGSEAEVKRLCADLRELMGPEALIGIDQEGGSVVRATFLPQPPAAMALGAADDEALSEAIGAAVARGLRGLGINWNFAPVLDINNNPANPVIAERSFGEEPERVTRLAGAWMRGSLAEGVACCVKHFPGHGDTHVDSHHALPAVDKTLAQLEALELKPFRALAPIAPAVMTAHIVYPQIDPEHPATLSKRVLTGILRKAMGYDGVVITDALMMKAIHERYGHARAAVLALQAGADLVLAQGARHEQLAAIESIDAALRDGSVPLARADQARGRVAALATRFPIRAESYADEQRASDDALMRAAWARGLVALGAPRPPRADERLRVFTQRSVPCDGVSEAGPSAEQIAALFAGFKDVELIALARLDDLDGASMPRDGRFNVLASNHRARYGAAAAGWRPDLHLVLWNPYQALDVAAAALVSWGYADGALAAVKAWLDGRADALPTPPVTLAPRAA